MDDGGDAQTRLASAKASNFRSLHVVRLEPLPLKLLSTLRNTECHPDHALTLRCPANQIRSTRFRRTCCECRHRCPCRDKIRATARTCGGFGSIRIQGEGERSEVDGMTHHAEGNMYRTPKGGRHCGYNASRSFSALLLNPTTLVRTWSLERDSSETIYPISLSFWPRLQQCQNINVSLGAQRLPVCPLTKYSVRLSRGGVSRHGLREKEVPCKPGCDGIQ